MKQFIPILGISLLLSLTLNSCNKSKQEETKNQYGINLNSKVEFIKSPPISNISATTPDTALPNNKALLFGKKPSFKTPSLPEDYINS